MKKLLFLAVAIAIAWFLFRPRTLSAREKLVQEARDIAEQQLIPATYITFDDSEVDTIRG